MFALFVKGFIIGFAIAAPVGPIGVLCIQRSLYDGFKVGMMTGMGAAIADATYGLVAGFGLTAVSAMLIGQQYWIRVLGGAFLLYLGVKIFFEPPVEPNANDGAKKSLWHAFMTSYFLTLTSPMTILSFVAIFASVGMRSTDISYWGASLFIVGITLGSALWWLILSGGAGYFLRSRVNTKIMRIINQLSGATISVFGLIALKVLVSV